MSPMKSIEIKCLNDKCGKWFESPILFPELETLTSVNVNLSGNLAQCTHCGSMTPCNKENMRARATDGGFMGSDTQ